MPVKIRGVNEHARIRNVTLEQAQQFIDEAVVMFDQVTRSMYLSFGGSATVLLENGRLISAYTKEDFDPAILAVLAIVGMMKDE